MGSIPRMLPVLIPMVWLAIVTVVLAACHLAARADAIATSPKDATAATHDPALSLPGLTVWDCSDPVGVRDAVAALSSASPRRPTRQGRPTPRRRRTGSRARGVHGGTRSLTPS
jgi:hypothetical protein